MADEKSRAIDLALAQIEKQFGKGSIMRLGSREVLPIAVISTGAISFDAALGVGGFPRGRVVEVFGPESSGKTTIALQVIAEAQKAGGLAAFIDAAQKGNMAALENLFAEDVASYSDGGGLVRAAQKPLSGRERVAKFIAAFSSHFWTGVTIEWVEVNGQSSVLVLRDGSVAALATIDASVEGIDQILWLMRPSKLVAVSRSRQPVGQPYSSGLAIS